MSITCVNSNGVLCVFKPSDLPTVVGEQSPALTELVLREYPEQSKIVGFHENEGGLLYRLDNETSGVVLFATSQKVFDQFTADVQVGRVKKHYLAYVRGVLQTESGTINFPIAHHPRSKRKMVAQKEDNQQKRGNWRPATTLYKVIKRDSHGNCWIHVMILQGARHQIRVHCAAIGYPLVGDKLYDASASTDSKLFLRCESIEWTNKQQIFSLTDLALTQEENGIFPPLTSLTIG